MISFVFNLKMSQPKLDEFQYVGDVFEKFEFLQSWCVLKNGEKKLKYFCNFWHTLMTKKCSEGLDLNFFMYWSTKKNFVKIGAPLVQKCSALPEYSQ